jgi:hypothetical protein
MLLKFVTHPAPVPMDLAGLIRSLARASWMHTDMSADERAVEGGGCFSVPLATQVSLCGNPTGKEFLHLTSRILESSSRHPTECWDSPVLKESPV